MRSPLQAWPKESCGLAGVTIPWRRSQGGEGGPAAHKKDDRTMKLKRFVLAAVGLAGMGSTVLAQAAKSGPSAQANTAQGNPTRECAARAAQDRITGRERDVFMRECVAGEKLDASRPSKK